VVFMHKAVGRSGRQKEIRRKDMRLRQNNRGQYASWFDAIPSFSYFDVKMLIHRISFASRFWWMQLKMCLRLRSSCVLSFVNA